MEIAHLIGRLLFGGFFLYHAANHLLLRTDTLTAYAQQKGVGAPRVMVYAGGVLLLLGGGSILLGALADWGIVALLTFLVPVSLRMHAFWLEQGEARQIDRVNFMKNLALIGALLMLFAMPQPWPLALGG